MPVCRCSPNKTMTGTRRRRGVGGADKTAMPMTALRRPYTSLNIEKPHEKGLDLGPAVTAKQRNVVRLHA